MIINPWIFYRPDDIPDLTPRDDEEMVGCLAGACGAVVSTIIYVLLMYLTFNFTEGVLRYILFLIDGAVIYPTLMICLMRLSFKIGDKIYKKKKEKKMKSYECTRTTK